MPIRDNMIVEINPPLRGIPGGVQGVIARDKSGNRWLLHGGRLHPKQVRITETDFDAVYNKPRSEVVFSDGTSRGYHVVANIDSSALKLQHDIAEFVGECHRIRTFYVRGTDEAKLDSNVDRVELSLPESLQPYTRGAQDEKTIERKHAKIWHALTKYLNKRGISHTNERVGRWGPDLRTVKSPHVLFEIKADMEASDLQRGLGQLLLYEAMLGCRHAKILLLPARPPRELAEPISKMGVNIVTFGIKGGTVVFHHDLGSHLTETRSD